MKVIHGNFYFKSTTSGNLIGEFTNIHIKNVCCENAILFDKGNELFVGKYYSNWNEAEEYSELYILQIIKKDYKYYLEWRNKKDNNIYYLGEGFLVDNILVGMYYSK